MSRASLFLLVLIVGAAAVWGLLALTRTSAASDAEGASGGAGSDQIQFRLSQLDKVEADLRQRIAAASKPIPASTTQAQPAAVRQGEVVVTRSQHADDDAYEHEDGSEDAHGHDGEGDERDD
ncbi:MAG: hypothetical protein FJW96_11370 [Actinobacteria bacterium]|nr:hypothetical protein [Actinomycetota bacterium]